MLILSRMFRGSTNSAGTMNGPTGFWLSFPLRRRKSIKGISSGPRPLSIGDVVDLGVAEHVVLRLVNGDVPHGFADDAKELTLVLVFVAYVHMSVHHRLPVSDKNVRRVGDHEKYGD